MENIFIIIFSGIVAISTVVYAILTGKLVGETKRMREVQTEPKVWIRIQPREEWINLVDFIIHNIGLGPAYNIRFEISPDFEYTQGKFLSELNLIKNGLKFLAPNQKLQFFLTSMVEDFKQKTETPFAVKVKFQNSVGSNFEETYVVDFSELVGLAQLGEPPLHKLAKNIETLQRDIHHISTGFHRVRAIVYTKTEYEEEQQQQIEEFKKRQSKEEKTNDKKK